MGQSYRELIAWQKTMDFVVDIYKTTKVFPRDEVYGLASQMRRTAIFVPTNIAEGQARYSSQEFHYSLGRARGYLVGGTQLMIAQSLGYISPEHGQVMRNKAADFLLACIPLMQLENAVQHK